MASIWVSQLGTNCSSKTLVLLFSTLLLQGPLCGESNPISGTHQRHRPSPGLGDGHGGVVDLSLLEQDGSVDMQSLLESLKEQFLRTFNLSGPPMPPGSAREEPPEYMMELYNRFANDHTAMPSANIIRSFKNEDSSPSVVGVGGVRRHPLLFNVSVPDHERITAAELRLYTLVQTDRHLYAGVDRKVTIYELESHDLDDNMTDGNSMRGDAFRGGGERIELVELASRQVYGTDNSWEAFDLTAAVQRWRKTHHGTTHRLEVQIASMTNDDVQGVTEDNKDTDPPEGDMKIDTSPEEKHKPLLIVFSDDQSSDHRDDKRELNEMIDHETSNTVLQNDLGTSLWGELGRHREAGDEVAEPDEEDLIQMRSNLIYDTASRIRRNAKGNHCKKQSLYVEFKDIGWDSWILAPTGYDAFECTGVCSFPLTKHVTPTKHAIVQTLVNINSPQKAARACCVPTKLDPISLLYLDDTGVVTYKYKFEGMVVAECGCR
ncbi:bone morphogenetic protein 10-like [Seriola lalandi dorsalis]|uniref:Bone morphogenetic protein 10 n=1 Tax=Seriola lalandi dorsalis TaxID=1841481 RepID=A0A3B4XQA6_SERLL|nr:bone morphogenetic protein 10-like [Seriola lalandi dorsalis]XP_056233352.1 bone morphogenetic protein 10 [Seriola aureovittata]